MFFFSFRSIIWKFMQKKSTPVASAQKVFQLKQQEMHTSKFAAWISSVCVKKFSTLMKLCSRTLKELRMLWMQSIRLSLGTDEMKFKLNLYKNIQT